MELTPGVMVTIGLAALAFAAQWGHSTALLNQINIRLDELLKVLARVEEVQREHEKRITMIEGKCEATHREHT